MIICWVKEIGVRVSYVVCVLGVGGGGGEGVNYGVISTTLKLKSFL